MRTRSKCLGTCAQSLSSACAPLAASSPPQLFVVGFNQHIHALLLLFRQISILLQEYKFFVVRIICCQRRNGASFFGMSDYIIYRGRKAIRNSYQCADIRFNIMILILVDRLLTYANTISQLLLRHSFFFPQKPKIF